MLMGVVSAASLWGNYKGNQVIRLTVDGVPVKVSDAPAVSMDGRTMIPIYLLKEAGVKYSWDGKSQTVDIQSLNENSIRTWARVSDYQSKLDNLLTDYIKTMERINSAGISAELSSDPDFVIKIFDDISLRIDYVAKLYASTVSENSQKIRGDYSSMGASTSRLDTIEDNMDSLINDFLKTHLALIDSYKDKSSNEKYNLFISTANNTYNKINDTDKLIGLEYETYQSGAISGK
jgi:hypothetical protein